MGRIPYFHDLVHPISRSVIHPRPLSCATGGHARSANQLHCAGTARSICALPRDHRCTGCVAVDAGHPGHFPGAMDTGVDRVGGGMRNHRGAADPVDLKSDYRWRCHVLFPKGMGNEQPHRQRDLSSRGARTIRIPPFPGVVGIRWRSGPRVFGTRPLAPRH